MQNSLLSDVWTGLIGEVGGRRMIGIIEIDEQDVSDDGHIMLEFPVEPERPDGMQTYLRVKTNLKLIKGVRVSSRGVVLK